MKKLILISMLFVGSIVYSQEISKEKQTNAQYVFELYKKNPSIKKIIIISVNNSNPYGDEWLEDFRVEGEYLFFSKDFKQGQSIHRWNIKGANYIVKNWDEIQVKLTTHIGHKK